MKKLSRHQTGKRILLVEDDEWVLVLMQHILVTAGYQVDAVATVSAALDHLALHRYHLVMTDDRLPDGRGIQIADVAREKGIDAVVLTGYMLQSTRADLDRYEHLMKPVRPTEIVEAAKRHLATSDL